ncbi:uncharacterized protein LOC119744591 [Patiria miniata]|uniref:Uncharacterized protein n=1 Tax=Patiria miniata TaxID=46514 RepID=A0A914BKS2_PATMI|nr:uncharacterized protein LOC119744591 [Patiria miniata]
MVDTDQAHGPGMMGMKGESQHVPLQGLPPDAQGLELFDSREDALKIFRKFKEISNRQDSADKFKKNFEPSKPGALVSFEATLRSVDRTTIEEMGLASSITEWDKFPGVLKTMFYKWRFDPTVMAEVMQFVVFIKRMDFTLKVGDPIGDVGLVSMAKEDVSFSSLHVHKERPLVVIASSLS